ncbi:glutamyl-tRNA synthetase [Lysobacter concretionis Ko07 = DSM 16239]|uniref:Glutamate--tRNA ligase n=1 Tax=Lysobacter concretionis Ko07 = DSM 16239 TaxID=1122185 RepID=A0A0A0EQU2_9GAMM|nr:MULTISPECIES: glutamate--tRNA ligase [Lysobacter]KGM52595.1 glutamyl-tRNA synthetase [Lysobacter concretionis Ko07 = DSM 16239]QOD91646.1 glutamate--tRNA ligase [Lysobacter sp. CW239]
MTCRTRFAPSPTGYLHIGGARTALYCWLEARHRGGEFILRIEDTDRERSTQAAIDAILQAMEWLGLDYDEGPIYQTHRLERYREVAEQLVASGHAYYAYETKAELEAMREAAMAANEKPRYNGAYRDQDAGYRDDPNRVIRFKNPLDGVVAWGDKVKGRIEIANSELDDLVIFRSDGYATYNFAVVVDDLDMRITDVVRGDDHVNNTPRQINIYKALGAEVPHFAHLPMILDPEGAKLSKRTGAADVMEYRDAGYLPHALLNYLVRLGWSHGDQEIFSIDEMKSLFDLKDVNAKASRLDPAKLGWLNQQYLKNDDPTEVGKHLEWHLRQQGYDLAAGPAPADIVIALRDRVQTLKDMAERSAVWFGPLVDYDEAAVAKHLKPAARAPLADARDRLARLTQWTADSVSAALHETAAALELGMGKVAQPLRVAITGTQVSPDIAHTVYLAGQAEAVKRIDAALEKVPAEA